jgi:hypothetical protein
VRSSSKLSVAAGLYLAALTAPIWMMALWFTVTPLWCAWRSGGHDGSMHNCDSIEVSIVDARSTRSWRVLPGQTIGMDRGHYRVGDSVDVREFDPTDLVLASGLTWEIGRNGVRRETATSLDVGLSESMGILIVGFVVAASYLTASVVASKRAAAGQPADGTTAVSRPLGP